MNRSKLLKISLAALALLPSLAPARGYRYHEYRHYQPERVVYREAYRPFYVAYHAPRCEPAPVVYAQPRVVVRGDNAAPALFAGLILGAAIGTLAYGR